ncbi:unnamed protein product [Peronospora destructor]|uniref:Uncharacterized protein n=1 Tax=Peronospora destructor TaxID=86335 RepID=A0AAV0V3E5_9STRA|nr:unnamed protein product [Peronospora destructor]
MGIHNLKRKGRSHRAHGSGLLTIVIGILYGTVLSAYVNSAVKDRVVRCSDDKVPEEVFLDPYGDCDDCSPYCVSVYMLNATNAKNYLAKNVKLQVQEWGPTYDAYTVTYKTYTYHTFEAELSCNGCSASDEIVSLDTGHLSVIDATGGEFNLLASVAAQSFASGLSTTELTATITEHAIADLDLSGFAYNGLLVKRTASQWALGYPSLLAGLILGANYVGACTLSMNAQCASCSGDDCLASQQLTLSAPRAGLSWLINNITCSIVESIYAAKYGIDEAANFAATTCGLCESAGLCAAPLPGIAESSGMDYSKTAPDASILNNYVKRTGCDDLIKIGTYVKYNGITVTPMWVNLGKRRDPTLAEINSYSIYANCDSPVANITCFNVSGMDGTALKPGGVTINRMAKHTTADSFDSYIGSAEIYIAILSPDTEVDFNGVSLHRFGTPADTFNYTDANADIGTGVSVNGLQQLSFVTGFLSFMSGPFFIYDDLSLLEAVQMTSTDGTTMSARKRLQILYALAVSMYVPNASMSNVLWPTLPMEVVPAYWVQEAGEAKDSVLDTFKSTLAFVKTFLVGLIVLVIIGIVEAGRGIFFWRRYNQKLETQRYDSVI